jgi:hypothetical protein
MKEDLVIPRAEGPRNLPGRPNRGKGRSLAALGMTD